MTAVLVMLILVLAVGVVLRDTRLPGTRDCPSAAFVGAALAMAVGAPSSTSEPNFLACSYPARGGRALSIDASSNPPGTPSSAPCRARPAIPALGRGACDMSGTSGTSRQGASVLVQPASEPGLEIQFTSYTARIPLAKLEALAAKTLETHPLPLAL